MNLQLTLLTAIVVSSVGVDLRASQRPSQPGEPPEQLTVAAQRPLRLTIPVWIEPPPRRLGVFTIVPPERPGEVVRVAVPIGALTMRAAHAVGQAQQRRAERKARKEVEQALKDLQAAQR
jgi:hypothetical protein